MHKNKTIELWLKTIELGLKTVELGLLCLKTHHLGLLPLQTPRIYNLEWRSARLKTDPVGRVTHGTAALRPRLVIKLGPETVGYSIEAIK